MNRFYDRYVRLNHVVLRSDDPGDDGVKPVNTTGSDLPDDPWEALEKAGESFSADLDALRAEDEKPISPAKDPAPSTPAAGEPPPPAQMPAAGAAPSPQPQVPDQWYELQRQQTEALKALAQSRAPQPEPQQQPKPQLPDLPEDLFEDWRAPARHPNMSEDQYAYDVVRSMSTHAARKGFDLARERTRAEVMQEVAPVIQYVQQQHMNQLWQRYYGELDQAVGSAGYAKGTNQHQMVAQAVNGLAMQYANMGNQVTPQWLREAAKTYTKYLPPQSGPQGVVEQQAEVSPLTGSAPAGSGAPSSPPSVEQQPARTLDEANQNFSADLNRLFGGRKAG